MTNDDSKLIEEIEHLREVLSEPRPTSAAEAMLRQGMRDARRRLPSPDDAWQSAREALKEDPESPEWKVVKSSYAQHLQWRFAEPEKAQEQRTRFANSMTRLLWVFAVVGLFFSGVQLYWAYKIGNFSALNTQFSQEAGALSFKTSMVGVAVLAVTVFLIWLYYKYVYTPLSETPLLVSFAQTDATEVFRNGAKNSGKSKQSQATDEGDGGGAEKAS